MRIGLAARADVPGRVAVARRIIRSIGKRADVILSPGIAKRLKRKGTPLEKMEVDALVTVGGDGTILYAMQRSHAPILGVNMGELGFLTEVERKEVPQSIRRLIAGDFFVEERLRLAVFVNGKEYPPAINEAVVRTAKTSKLLHLSVRVDGNEIERFRADGVILATPTGSTSYSMSAGGPLMDPSVDAILMTPLAAFRLNAKPYVLSSSSRLETRLLSPEKEALLVLDGQLEERISHSDRLVFTGASQPARFIRFRHSFYERLKERLVP